MLKSLLKREKRDYVPRLDPNSYIRNILMISTLDEYILTVLWIYCNKQADMKCSFDIDSPAYRKFVLNRSGKVLR